MNKKEIKNKIDSQEFYDLMQAYRIAPFYDQSIVSERFQAVKDFILQSLEQPEEKEIKRTFAKPCINFKSDNLTSSSTICKHCGHERYNHIWDEKIYPNGF
jgi:hypothetical protein